VLFEGIAVTMAPREATARTCPFRSRAVQVRVIAARCKAVEHFTKTFDPTVQGLHPKEGRTFYFIITLKPKVEVLDSTRHRCVEALTTNTPREATVRTCIFRSRAVQVRGVAARCKAVEYLATLQPNA